jgi:hypothetical protein
LVVCHSFVMALSRPLSSLRVILCVKSGIGEACRVKLQAKFNLGIIAIFAILAAGIAITSVNWANHNTISEAERRVNLYIRSSWEIYNGKLARLHSATEVLANKKMVQDLLNDPRHAVKSQEAHLQSNKSETIKRMDTGSTHRCLQGMLEILRLRQVNAIEM